MSTFDQFLAVALLGFMSWMLYRGLSYNREMLSKDLLLKSLHSIGVLAILLMVLVVFVVKVI